MELFHLKFCTISQFKNLNVFVVVVGGGGGSLCNCVVNGGRGCGGAMPLPLHFTELFIGSSVIAALDSPLLFIARHPLFTD